MPPTWTLDEAIALIKLVEDIAPACGCHVALTGGLLYKDGPRKDLDLLFYRIRSFDKVDRDKLFEWLVRIGIDVVPRVQFVVKATYHGKPIDLFFPETDADDYEQPVSLSTTATVDDMEPF